MCRRQACRAGKSEGRLPPPSKPLPHACFICYGDGLAGGAQCREFVAPARATLAPLPPHQLIRFEPVQVLRRVQCRQVADRVFARQAAEMRFAPPQDGWPEQGDIVVAQEGDFGDLHCLDRHVLRQIAQPHFIEYVGEMGPDILLVDEGADQAVGRQAVLNTCAMYSRRPASEHIQCVQCRPWRPAASYQILVSFDLAAQTVTAAQVVL